MSCSKPCRDLAMVVSTIGIVERSCTLTSLELAGRHEATCTCWKCIFRHGRPHTHWPVYRLLSLRCVQHGVTSGNTCVQCVRRTLTHCINRFPPAAKELLSCMNLSFMPPKLLAVKLSLHTSFKHVADSSCLLRIEARRSRDLLGKG